MHVLVLGGYGLIGSAIVRRLLAEGFAVTGLGRAVNEARRRVPAARWTAADIATLSTMESWRGHLVGIDAVVNAAGALQDAPDTDLEALQATSMRALYAACEEAGVTRVVQISAAGASERSGTAFLRTKAAADAALARSSLDWTILRPGLVIGAKAYGGTAMLRALAAFPIVLPLAHADARLRTVALDDVVGAVLDALRDRLPTRKAYDLVEAESRTLADAVGLIRAWLGLPPAPIVRLADATATVAAVAADALGNLGWRSPMRSTSMTVLAGGIDGDGSAFAQVTLGRLTPLNETLAAIPCGAEDRWFARLYLAKPLIFGILVLFWLVSGVVGLVRFEAAALLLTRAGVPESVARLVVVGGSLADIVLGALILHRRTARAGLLGAMALSLAYLTGATVVTPALWLDPLGPLVKIAPATVLALVGLAILDDR